MRIFFEKSKKRVLDYFPFGWSMPGRKFNSGDYRFGFNGMERDDELKGEGNSYDFGARIYDNRVGRWLSVDPLQTHYPSLSPYNGMGNNPIYFIDPDGKRIIPSPQFKLSVYYKTYLQLSKTENSVFKKYSSIFVPNDSRFDLVYDAKSVAPTQRAGYLGWTNPDPKKVYSLTQKSVYNIVYYMDSSPTNELEQVVSLIHETIHAYLKSLKYRKSQDGLDVELPHQHQIDEKINDTEHDLMGTDEMITEMIAAQEEYIKDTGLRKKDGSEYSREELEAIAWQGLKPYKPSGWRKMDETEEGRAKKASIIEIQRSLIRYENLSDSPRGVPNELENHHKPDRHTFEKAKNE